MIYSAGFEVQILVWFFIYIQTLCMAAAKALVTLPICADLPKPSLLDNAISTNLVCCPILIFAC